MSIATLTAAPGRSRSAAMPFEIASDEDPICAPSAPNAKSVLDTPTEMTDDVLTLAAIDDDALSESTTSSLI